MDTTYELVDRKTVPDSDGFLTDYSWYTNTETGEQVMVFGDSELYTPEDGWFDAEFDNYDEAEEWFNSYEGIEDDEDEVTMESRTLRIKTNESTTPDHRKASRFMYKGYVCDKCEDGFKIFTTTEWNFGKGLRLSEVTVADEDAAKDWINKALMGGAGITVKESKRVRRYKKEAVDKWVQQYGIDIVCDETMEDTETRINMALTKAGLKVLGVMAGDGWDIDDYKRTTGVNALESKKSVKKEAWTSANMEQEIYDALNEIYDKWDHYFGDKAQWAEVVGTIADRVWESANDLDECTNSSSVGQFKKDSIDIIDEAGHPDKDVLKAVVNALKDANIKFEFRGKQNDEILVQKADLEKASELRNKLDPNYTVTVMCAV